MGKRKDYGKNADHWFENIDDQISPIAVTLRELIKDSVPGIKETVKWGIPNYIKDRFVCALRSGKGYIALQFGEIGTTLNDPDSLLEGSGKKMRHVKLWEKSDIKKKLFRSWIKKSSEKQ